MLHIGSLSILHNISSLSMLNNVSPLSVIHNAGLSSVLHNVIGLSPMLLWLLFVFIGEGRAQSAFKILLTDTQTEKRNNQKTAK